MSLILDALKRSEQERQEQSASITASRSIAPPTNRWPTGRWLISGLLINALLLSAVYYWFSKGEELSAQDKNPPLDTGAHSMRPGAEEEPFRPPRPLAVEAAVVPVNNPPSLIEQTRLSTASKSSVQVSSEKKSPPHDVTEVDASYVPSIDELPDDIRAKLTTLELNAHVYSSTPKKRFVLINMGKYRVGETISGTRYQIRGITEQGVIIDYGEGEALLR